RGEREDADETECEEQEVGIDGFHGADPVFSGEGGINVTASGGVLDLNDVSGGVTELVLVDQTFASYSPYSPIAGIQRRCKKGSGTVEQFSGVVAVWSPVGSTYIGC